VATKIKYYNILPKITYYWKIELFNWQAAYVSGQKCHDLVSYSFHSYLVVKILFKNQTPVL